MNDFIKKYTTSSVDPNKTSLMVRGLLMSLVPLIMWKTGMTEADTMSLVEYGADIVFVGTLAYAVIAAAWGALRKLYAGRWSALD